MKNTVIVPQVHLHPLNVFDVGNNPEHLNRGLTTSGLVSWVEHHIDAIATAKYLTISGYALELLDEEAPELVEQMKQLIEEHHISLIGMPYYNTSFSLLSPHNFAQQWSRNQQALRTYLGREANTLFVGNQHIPEHLSESIQEMNMSIVGEHSLHLQSLSLGHEETKNVLLDVGDHSPYHSKKIPGDMAQHIRQELIALEPFLAQDTELSTTWQLLASTQVLESLEGHNPQVTYNNYSSMMNILNDVAHTIRNVELTKQGKFETQAEIVEEPSTRILDVMKPNEVNQ